MFESFSLLFTLTFSSGLKHRCLSAFTEEYRGTNLSHYFQFACAADPKAVEERAATPLLSGREHTAHWLFLPVRCQHSWMGVEGEVMCTRKRTGTDYIICRVRGKQGPNWDWVTVTVPCLLCGRIKAMHCPLFRAGCSGARLICDFCCLYRVSSVILNIYVVL